MATNPLTMLLCQRLPFLSLFAFAACGIAIAEVAQAASFLWLALAGLAAGAFFATRRTIAFAALTVCVFGTIHVWQSTESQSARFAVWLDGRVLSAEARGIVASEPRVLPGGSCSFEFRLSQLRIANTDLAVSFLLHVESVAPPPAYGDAIWLRGTVARIESPRNPGQFDFAAWSARRDIFTRMQVEYRSDMQILQQGQGNPLVALALRARGWLRGILTEGVNDATVSDLLVAMVLGDASSLPQVVEEEFRGTGTFHLFSVSGLHVGMVAVLLWYFLKTFRISRRHAAGLIIPLLFLYVLMTGLKAASVRSALMAALVLSGLMANRRPILLNNLCAAGFLILLSSTNELFNPGFQLSFSVVAAIMLLATPLSSALAIPFRRDPFFPERLLSAPQRLMIRSSERFSLLIAVSAAAWLGSLPLTIGYFHLVSLTAVPANAVAVPLSFAIMAVSILSLGGGLFSTWVASIYNQTNWLLAKTLLAAVHGFASVPGSFFYVRFPDPPSLIAQVVVFDLGSGGATWIAAEGRHWLIDTGPAQSHNSVLLPFLRSMGLRSLDGVLLTHGDAGHIGSAIELLQTCPPRRVVESSLSDRSAHRARFHQELVRLGLPKSPHRSGDQIVLGTQTRLQILYLPGDVARGVADDKSLIVQLVSGSTRVLFMSDGGLFTEDWLTKNIRDNLRSNILIKGSPEQGPSGDAAFLDAVSPAAVIATAAEFPENETISPSFAESLRKRGIRLFAQDRCGAVVVRIFSTHWEVSAFLDKRQYCQVR